MLRAIREIDARHPIDLVPTFMGAHEVPPEFRDARADYIRTIVEEMIPAVAAGSSRAGAMCSARLACLLRRSRRRFSRRASLRASSRAYTPRLGPSGGSEVAARVGARSADHLVHVSEAGMHALATGGVTATCCLRRRSI